MTNYNMTLKTSHGDVDWVIRHSYPEESVSQYRVTPKFEEPLSKYVPREFVVTFYGHDMADLADFFDRQVESIRRSGLASDEPYRVFVTLGNEIEFVVSDGLELDSIEEGVVCLQIRINLQHIEATERSLWLGFDCEVDLEDLLIFCNELRSFDMRSEN